MPLSPFYGNVDVVGAYDKAREQNAAIENMGLRQQMTLAAILQKKQQMAQEQSLAERGLGLKEKALQVHSADLTEQRKSREDMAAMALEQKRASDLNHWDTQAKIAQMQHEYRMGDLTQRGASAAEKAAETARHNKAMEGIQSQLNDLKAQTNPVAIKERDKVEGRTATTELLNELEADYGKLQTQGSDISPQRGAVQNIYNRISSSGPGQLVAGAVGTESQATRDSINQKRASLMASIKQATGMGATQLNSNVELQFYLKMATDPTMSRDANKKAINWLRNTYGSKGEAAAPTAPAAGGLTPQEQQELETLRKQLGR